MQTIKDKEYEGQKVLVGVDWNLPLTKDSPIEVTDTTRIERVKETILYLSECGAKVALLSHLGRPKGERVPEFSLKVAVKAASELLEKEIKFVDDCVGENVKKAIDNLKNGEILLLENVRYHSEETDYKKKSDDPKVKNFAKEIASYFDEFVEDAFARCHRKAVSTVGVVKEGNLPTAVGFLVQNEIANLSKLFNNPKDNFYAVIGGAKITDKVDTIESLLEYSNKIFIGGAMAYPFLKAMGKEVGQSKLNDADIPIAEKVIKLAKENDVKLVIPIDHLVASEFAADAVFENTNDENIPENMMGLDIGEKTIDYYKKELEDAKTIFWNGPMGVFEFEKSSKGTFEIAQIVATIEGAFTVVGGGDSVSAVKKSGYAERISFISTAGGASLDFVKKRGKIPGLLAVGFEGI